MCWSDDVSLAPRGEDCLTVMAPSSDYTGVASHGSVTGRHTATAGRATHSRGVTARDRPARQTGTDILCQQGEDGED